MSFVLINSISETFTPTKSGAICTNIWEIANCAKRDGIVPWIITKTHNAEPYDWPKTIFIKYPYIPKNKYLSKLFYIERDITGWGHIRQKAFNSKLFKAIRKANIQHLPLVVNNDIELTVALHEEFPEAKIFHYAHNENTCDERFRKKFKSAVTTAMAVSNVCGGWNRGYFELDDIKIIYAGVDTDRFSPPESIPENPPLINFVGRTDRSKGVDLFLLAAKKLSTKTKNFRLQILGSNHYGYSVMDDFQATIEKLAEELEADGISVRRPGFIDRWSIPDELRKAHINVIPSRWHEPFGLVTVEGMASGLATIASNTGGIPEVVGNSGLMFENGNIEELTDHMERLITDTDFLIKYRKLARERAEQFTWTRAWNSMRKVIGV